MMRTVYKGCEIKANRKTKNSPIDYIVTRRSDGFVVTEGIDYEEITIVSLTEHLKGVVDDFITDPSAYITGDVDFNDDLPPDDLDDFEFEEDENAEPLEEQDEY